MPSTQFSVQLRGATKRYGLTAAADAVTLDIRHGEFFTLLGSSGSGKTTTLRLIGGFEFPDDGRIFINGRDVTSQPAHERNVHTVFQDYALFPHMTVFNNVAYACELKRLPRDDIRKRVQRAIALVQLEGLDRRKPSQLSGGQQQRVALARALVDEPAVLLLDEPLSALDAKIRAEVREELKTLQRNTGITFIYVTHDQEEALTLSDRVAVMRNGRVAQVDTPIQLYEYPANLFVASFIGKANFLPGLLLSLDDKKARVRVNEGVVEGRITTDIPVGAHVRVMIRPENIRLAPGNTRVTVKQATYLGHSTEYILSSGKQTLRALEIRRLGSTPHSVGAELLCGWNWEDALVYEDDGSALTF
ncbi:MAG TPA: ABC transporter ATP-binding protein [Chthoniobacterales bacterium]